MKTPPPLHIPRNSKRKRVFMDVDVEVVEIPPPVFGSSSKSGKQKKIIPEIIDLDDYEEPVVILGKRLDGKNKGIVIKEQSDGFGSSQPKNFISNNSSDHTNMKKNGVPSFGSSAPNNFMAVNSDLPYMNEYSAGVDANIPWYGGGNLNPIPSSNQNWQNPVNYGEGNLYPPLYVPEATYTSMNYPIPQQFSVPEPWIAPGSKNKKAKASFGGASNWGPFDPMTDFSLDLPSTYPSDEQHWTTLFGQPISSGASGSKNKAINLAKDIPVNQSNAIEDEILKKFKAFKQFDTAEGHSDHHYAANTSSKKQPPKKWAKAIQDEWRILEKDLPDTIFVRVYESRMDILRAVIIGAEGTPYHDGLFFFDVFFPDTYPSVPPLVHYHSGGLRLNPNLYNCGKVCLSLLNTWSGSKNEKWLPGKSTMLQVLVSIQALILNKDPFFNEPGYARLSGSASGDLQSQKYSEDALILSLKTMLYSMRNPPKHFEDFVVGHFYGRAHDILVACKAYMEGAQVGCLVKGGVQDLESGDKSCSENFKCSLKSPVKLLIEAFSKIGVKDCRKFLTPDIERVTAPKVANPKAHNFLF